MRDHSNKVDLVKGARISTEIFPVVDRALESSIIYRHTVSDILQHTSVSSNFTADANVSIKQTRKIASVSLQYQIRVAVQNGWKEASTWTSVSWCIVLKWSNLGWRCFERCGRETMVCWLSLCLGRHRAEVLTLLASKNNMRELNGDTEEQKELLLNRRTEVSGLSFITQAHMKDPWKDFTFWASSQQIAFDISNRENCDRSWTG